MRRSRTDNHGPFAEPHSHTSIKSFDHDIVIKEVIQIVAIRKYFYFHFYNYINYYRGGIQWAKPKCQVSLADPQLEGKEEEEELY